MNKQAQGLIVLQNRRITNIVAAEKVFYPNFGLHTFIFFTFSDISGDSCLSKFFFFPLEKGWY